MKRLVFNIFLLLNPVVLLDAQSPYSLNWKTDGLILGSASVLAGVNIITGNSMDPLSSSDIAGLDVQEIHWIDRWVTERESKAADFRSDAGLLVSSALGAGSVAAIPYSNRSNNHMFSEFLTLSVLWLETNLINFEGTGLIKNTVQRIRPEVYRESFAMDVHEPAYLLDLKRSYFSRHVSVSAANTFFFAKLFSDYYPDSEWKPAVWGIAALLPAWNGLERLLAGKHYTTDVISGFIFGAACGYFIPQFHKRSEDKNAFSLQAIPYTDKFGSGASVVFVF